MKQCSRCKYGKPIDEFALRNDRPSGRHSQCKKCVREQKQMEYAKNSQRYRDAQVKHSYGISGDEYREKLRDQKGVCAICRQPERIVIASKVAELAVDHDHDNGVVRDLLCAACNRGLAAFGDDPSRLEVAAAYLRHHGRK